MNDRYHGDISANMTAPAVEWFAITPSDGAKLQERPRAVYVGVGGDVTVVSRNGVSATFTAAAGAILPIRPYMVMATGTTASGLVALL